MGAQRGDNVRRFLPIVGHQRYRHHGRCRCPRRLGRAGETTDDVYNTANEESTSGGEEADSLPELVSGGEDSSEDSGYNFLNAPTNEEEKDFEAAAEIEVEEKPKEDKDTYSENEEEQLEESINFILGAQRLINLEIPVLVRSLKSSNVNLG